MPDDELTSRFDGLRERLAPLVEEPPVTATGRGRPGGALNQGPVAPPPRSQSRPPRRPRRPSRPAPPASRRPARPARRRPPPFGACGSWSRGPGPWSTQASRCGCAPSAARPGGQGRVEDGTALRARQDGSFTTSFEIPPGPTGDFFLDATCGGATREVKLRREP